MKSQAEKLFENINKWRLNVLKAVEAQANDETLWNVNLPGKEMTVLIGEAYVQQSLRWLHKVIEENDLEALNSIIEQSEDINR
jgi:hypothetical protein